MKTLFSKFHPSFKQQVADDVEKKNLQLVGVTAMHIASKYEEMYAPEVKY